MKYCPKCKQILSLDRFNTNSSRSDGKQTYCRECQSEKDRLYYLKRDQFQKRILQAHRRQRNRQYKEDFLKTSKCELCGNSDFRVLDFHHLRDKKSEVSLLISNSSIGTIKKEMEKCRILCANCHRILHYNERDNQLR
jgi:hypothetical protein